MRYLVTGGCGFIGSHLVDSLLADGREVVVLDDFSTGRRENLDTRARLVVGDVADHGLVAQCMRDVDGCFHLAAVASVQKSVEDWPRTHRSNQTGSITVFDSARRPGGEPPLPVVFASSAAVYGNNLDIPLAENSALDPISPYGADKLGSELHARAGASVHKSRVIGLRFFNVFGPRQDPASPYSGVISIFVDRVAKGAPITIFGGGEQTRDFVYVSDAVACLRRAMVALENADEAHFAVYNVCRGVGVSVNDLAGRIVALGSSPGIISHGPSRPGDINASVGAPDRARAELGFVAAVDLDDGLKSTLNWCLRAEIRRQT